MVNNKNHTLTKVLGFDRISNPSYNKKHKAIIDYGYSGTNSYSIYKINRQNKIYQIGASFEDTEELDLDKKIAEILRNTTRKRSSLQK